MGRLFLVYLARGRGLSVFCQSALASPADDTSSAPVSSKISFAFLVQSELSEYRKEGCPARRCRDNCLRLFRCWRWACRRRHTGVSVSACCVLQETHVAMAVVAVEAWRPSAAHKLVLADTL